MKQGVAIQSDLESHYIDHLGVLAAIVGIPFLLTDEEQYVIAKKYYPGLQARLVDWPEISPEAIVNSFDAIFTSHSWDPQFFEAALEHCQDGKKPRLIFCPHGNSDKDDGKGSLDLYLHHDGVLIYGQHMIDFLKETHVWDRLNRYVVTGNYRYSYYRQHQEFYRSIVHQEVLSHFSERKQVLLYSPTWNQDFFTTHFHVLENVPEQYNVIVKVHPRMMHEHLGMMLRVLERYRDKTNILILVDFPLIFPLLEHVDVYVGDMSSIGYDFLAFNRPMFFLNSFPDHPNPKRCFFLYQCGVELLPSDYNRLYSIIEQHLSVSRPELALKRQEIYHYAFGNQRPLDQLRKEILELI